ncbi:MAG: DUF996 domain-containing protein [Bacteroidota bacterium]
MRKQAITLGRVGILLPIAAIIPFLGTLAGLAAIILLLFSHHYFSKFYQKPAIFNKALIGSIVMIAGNIIGGAIFVAAMFSSVGSVDSMQDVNIQNMASRIFDSGLTILGAVVMLAGAIIGSYFLFQGLKVLAAESGMNHFRTAGLLYFIGAIASVIVIGFLVFLVGWVFHIVAYFSIQPETEARA